MNYQSPNRQIWQKVDDIDLSIIGATGRPTYLDTGSWLDMVRFDNGTFFVSEIQFGSTIDDDGDFIPLESDTTGNQLKLRVVGPDSKLLYFLTTGMPITNTVLTASEQPGNRAIAKGSRVQVQITPSGLTGGKIYLTAQFTSSDLNPKLTYILE